MVDELVALIVRSRLGKCSTLLQLEARLSLVIIINAVKAFIDIFTPVWWTFWRIINSPFQAHNLVLPFVLIKVFMVCDFENFTSVDYLEMMNYTITLPFLRLISKCHVL
jgi:hypothetical protein